MTRNDILAQLIIWAAQHETIEQAGDTLDDLCGATHDSVLGRALWGTLDAYTDVLEAHILGSAADGWLRYYRDECEMGALPRPVQVAGRDDIVLEGIEALTDLCVALKFKALSDLCYPQSAETTTARESAP